MYCPDALVYHVGSGTSGSKYNSFKVKLSARNNIWLIYKNMPLFQKIINFLPLTAGCMVKTLFFYRIGFGKDYIDGLREGFSQKKQCAKVPFQMKHLKNYLMIEKDLVQNSFVYASDWFNRKFFHK